MLWSFISLLSNCQNQCIVHFQRAWGNCLVVCRWLSASVCHSFQKSGSPVGFVVSACLQRLFVGLRLFRLNFFELIRNLFNFFHSSIAYTHVSIFECVGFEPRAFRVRVQHAYLSPTECHGIANAPFTPFLLMQMAPFACLHDLHLGRKYTILRAKIAHFARRLFFERARKITILRAQKALFAPVTKVG